MFPSFGLSVTLAANWRPLRHCQLSLFTANNGHFSCDTARSLLFVVSISISISFYILVDDDVALIRKSLEFSFFKCILISFVVHKHFCCEL